MQRKTVLVTAVGTDQQGRPWCALNESFFAPGDCGLVGPFQLLNVRYSADGQLLHYLTPGSDPVVGELLAIVKDDERAHENSTCAAT